jgi:hypothetical protein
MIYRGSGFLAWFGSSPISTPYRQQVVSVFLSVAGPAYWREGVGRGWKRAKSYDGEKALSSINHSIFSAATHKERAGGAGSLRGVQETEPIIYKKLENSV